MLALFVSTTFIVIGLIGTFLPVIPGTVVAFTGIALHKLFLGDASVSWGFVAAAAIITIITLVIDVWCTWWGARRFGASWKGALGAVAGGIIGFLFFNILGLIIGPIIGAVLFELIDDRSGPEAARAGFGTIVGSAVAFFLKFVLTASMATAFYLAL